MTNTLIIKFANKIAPHEVPLFRGAIIAAVGGDANVLFHNHEGNGFRFRYPMIQYKRIGGQAAIVCVGEGTEQIGSFFSANNFRLRIGDQREEVFEIDAVMPRRTMIQVWDGCFEYWLRGWLPLNSDNYQKYMACADQGPRTAMLERILVGNILSACKGLGICVEREIECRICDQEAPRTVYYKGLPMLSMDCRFKTNITLPDYIGLGKGASMGHGVIFRMRNRNNAKYDE